MSALPVEIAVQDAAGVLVAATNGAHRVELCSGLGVGGLTPSAGLINSAVAVSERPPQGALPGGVHVLVRPRAGGFKYEDTELATMAADVSRIAAYGASGVVVGALTTERQIDEAAMSLLVEAAGDLQVTFHRAFDVLADPVAGLEILMGLGVRRILSSGGAPRSIDGIRLFKDLVLAAAGRIELMAGGGVAVADIPALRNTGINAVHLSARTAGYAGPAGPGGGDNRYDITDAALVRAAVRAASDPDSTQEDQC